MRLIITQSIKETEFSPKEVVFTLESIKNAGLKAMMGLGERIKSSVKVPSTSLKKVYLTSSGGAARVLFLLKASDETSVLVMLRLKSDKLVGANMTIENPHFKKALEKNIDLILRDLERGAYEEYVL